MGCCVSVSQEQLLNSIINNELSEALRSDTDIQKLVLLGAGGSGKSTFFKQLRTIHGKGYSDTDRVPFKKHIYHQIIQDLKRMVRFAQEMVEEDPQLYARFKISDDRMPQAQYLQTIRDDTLFTTDIGALIETLWNDQAIRHMFEERAQFAVTDSTGIFLDDIGRIASTDYVPTYEDVLLCRQRTVGIVDKLFVIKGTQFRIFDVGGQRAERRKWIHCFEHVTGVVYVASLNGYNETMFEDEDNNVMQDSLGLFEKTCHNEWFKGTSVILFLNKSDLFDMKIQSVPITCCFPDYKGEHTRDASLHEIKKQFEARYTQKNSSAGGNARPLYVHVTCAVDDRNVKAVFNDVQHVLVSTLLDSFL